MNRKRVDRYLAALPAMSGKKVIITGANSGLGFECCRHLLGKGAHVVMACRNQEKMAAAAQNLQSEFPAGQISTLIFDMGSLEAVEASVERIRQEQADFDVIIFNAGVFRPGKDLWYTPGVPLTSGTNFVALLHAVTLLNDFIAGTDQARKVIIQGSAASYFSPYKGMEKSLLDNNRPLMKQYNCSKLGSECVFRHFQQAPHAANVRFGLCEPGACQTGVFRYSSPLYKLAVWFFTTCICFTARDGALPMTALAAGDLPDGSYLAPRVFFHMRGLPGKRRFPRRFPVGKMIADGYDIIHQLKHTHAL